MNNASKVIAEQNKKLSKELMPKLLMVTGVAFCQFPL